MNPYIVIPHRSEATLEAAIASCYPYPYILVEDVTGDGPSAARNTGTRRALELGATHVQYLDADDTLPPGKIVAQLEATTTDFSYCDVDVHIAGESVFKQHVGDLKERWLPSGVPQTGAFIFTRKVLETVQWTVQGNKGTTRQFVTDAIAAGFTYQYIPGIYTIWNRE